MARDHVDRPMTDDELADVSEAMHEQRDEIREYLEDEGVDVSAWDDGADDPMQEAERNAADSD